MFEYYTIAIIAILGAISPGPDFVVITKNALCYDRRSACFSALGIGVGILVHTTYCVLGFALIISQSHFLFDLIKYLGATYLLYLGSKSFFEKRGHIPTFHKAKKAYRSPWLAFRDGFLVNVLNPKCTLFMLSIFTFVIRPDIPMLIQGSYGIEIAAITTLWFLFLSYGLTTHWIKTNLEKIQHIVTKLIGIVLIAVAILIIFEAY